jgi:hypothetical protein
MRPPELAVSALRLPGGGAPRLREIRRFQLHQAGHLPYQVGFVVAEAAIRQYYPPHHLGEHHLLGQIILGRYQAGELKVVERLGSLCLGQPQELGDGNFIQTKVPCYRALNVPPLFGTEFVVGMSQLQQQGAGR